MSNIYIVAEIGCNHNGSVDIAREMILKAKEAGVNAVKFQTFKADKLISAIAPKAEYQIKNTGELESQLEMTKKLEMKYDDYLHLMEYAVSLNLDVFSTPFDEDSIDFLASLKQKIWKIPSGELLNLPYIEKIAKLSIPDKKIIISTGMATIDEIKQSVSIFINNKVPVDNITILHCNTEYPTPFEDVNLNAINDLKKHFPKNNIGFSDHSSGFYAAIAAVPYGITFIEKHFTLDKSMSGPDHLASIEPDELKHLCIGVRCVEKSLGSNSKVVTASERKNKIVARKSIIAKTEIKKGEVFSEKNITTKRPGNGISPMEWYNLLGKIAEQDFIPDELIIHSEFKNQGE